MPADGFDVVVVGAGPAGSMAALAATRAGASVCLLERGPSPGAKNLFGGVVYGGVLDGAVAQWRERAPLERRVTRRVTMLLGEHSSVALDVRTTAWAAGENGATVLRPAFDAFLAGEAESAGATLVRATTAVGLLTDGGGHVRGVRTDRPEGEVAAGVVVCCEGANAFLTREAGLIGPPRPSDYAVGVKQVLRLGSAEIERRFGLDEGEGADFEVLGAAGAVGGGGFVYTNAETVSVGLVLSLDGLRRERRRPEELLAVFTSHPSIAPLLSGGEVLEYGAHLVPEGGFDALSRLASDGIVVAGDAAGLCLSAGLFLEGVNFAIASGLAAGEAAAAAVAAGDTSRDGLSSYRERLADSFVLADLRRLRKAPGFLHSERVQHVYPTLACDVLEGLFTVDNSRPKPGLARILREGRRRHGLSRLRLWRDAAAAWRIFR